MGIGGNNYTRKGKDNESVENSKNWLVTVVAWNESVNLKWLFVVS